MITAAQVRTALRQKANPVKALTLQRFFKNGPGQYGEGDRFLGVVVPAQREIVNIFRDLPLAQVLKLLHSQVHEERMTAVLILVSQFERSNNPQHKKKIFDAYLSNTRWINNWDIVDVTTAKIVGAWLGDKSLATLKPLARSKNIWERRIAIISTQYTINQGNCSPTMVIAHLLLNDKQDLIHKAVGWMLREVGKRCSQEVLEDFLKQHASGMPRTMLRYSIEKFSKPKQHYYLNNF